MSGFYCMHGKQYNSCVLFRTVKSSLNFCLEALSDLVPTAWVVTRDDTGKGLSETESMKYGQSGRVDGHKPNIIMSVPPRCWDQPSWFRGTVKLDMIPTSRRTSNLKHESL